MLFVKPALLPELVWTADREMWTRSVMSSVSAVSPLSIMSLGSVMLPRAVISPNYILLATHIM